MSKEAFDKAHNWLFSLVRDPEGKRFNVAKTAEQRRQEMEEAMVRTADFLAFAGHPERLVPAVHVTGTSGKGSVSMMAAALLQGMGLKTGLHTSPYLQMPTEKLMANGKPVSLNRFADLVWHFKTVHEKWAAAGGPFKQLRYTEAWTAITFMWLAGQNLDVAVVEAGMGGRLDPTNHIASEISIVTNVAFDHIKSLGPRLTDIAWHKAGIMKPGKPAVTGVTQPDLLAVLEAEAAATGSQLFALGKEFDFEIHDPNTITVQGPFNSYERVTVGPIGRYQLGNAALAIAALDVLSHFGTLLTNGLRGHGLDALATCMCPGRMEIVSRNPLILLDGAHNPHKMQALVESVKQAYPDKAITAITGSIVNKEVEDILQVLVPAVDKIIATAPNVPGKPAVDPATIVQKVQKIKQMPPLSAEAAADISAAIERAKVVSKADDLILITGSLYLVGEARELWHPLQR